MGILAPKAVLEANPFPNAVAVVSLEDAASTGGQVSLPEGALRFAVSIKVRYRGNDRSYRQENIVLVSWALLYIGLRRVSIPRRDAVERDAVGFSENTVSQPWRVVNPLLQLLVWRDA